MSVLWILFCNVVRLVIQRIYNGIFMNMLLLLAMLVWEQTRYVQREPATCAINYKVYWATD